MGRLAQDVWRLLDRRGGVVIVELLSE